MERPLGNRQRFRKHSAAGIEFGQVDVGPKEVCIQMHGLTEMFLRIHIAAYATEACPQEGAYRQLERVPLKCPSHRSDRFRPAPCREKAQPENKVTVR